MITTDKLNRKGGLATDLLRRSVDLAKCLGFSGIKTEATGNFYFYNLSYPIIILPKNESRNRSEVFLSCLSFCHVCLVCLSVFLSFCLSVFLSFCLSVFLSFCLSVFLSFCLSVFVTFCFM
jgi:hypothetical protein